MRDCRGRNSEISNNLLVPLAEACKPTYSQPSDRRLLSCLDISMALFSDCEAMHPSATPNSHCAEGTALKCANLLLYLSTEITN